MCVRTCNSIYIQNAYIYIIASDEKDAMNLKETEKDYV